MKSECCYLSSLEAFRFKCGASRFVCGSFSCSFQTTHDTKTLIWPMTPKTIFNTADMLHRPWRLLEHDRFARNSSFRWPLVRHFHDCGNCAGIRLRSRERHGSEAFAGNMVMNHHRNCISHASSCIEDRTACFFFPLFSHVVRLFAPRGDACCFLC